MAIVATDNSRVSVEELKELAGFWAEKGDALSVYLQVKPSQLSYKEELIFAKEKIQEALGTLKGKNPAEGADIQRVMETVTGMKGNEGRAKVIFACSRQKVWHEYNLPGDFGARAEVGPAFTLAPLLAQHQGGRRYCIALADRNRARLLLLEAGQISEHSQILDEDKEKIRTTGARKSAHLERKKDEQVKKHYSFLAEHLLHFHEHKDYDELIIGCRDEMWPEIEAELHPELKRILVGRFLVDPGLAAAELIKEKAQVIVDQRDREEEARLVEKSVGAAAAKGLGAMGLTAVMGALEKGEVRTLLWPKRNVKGPHAAWLCRNCGHLETAEADTCALCGWGMRRFARAEEALLRHTLGRGIEVRLLRCAKLPPPNEVAALLRFRAETHAPQALAS